jgi:hypothetical protein
LMRFFENEKFVSAVREKYVSLASAKRPELFSVNRGPVEIR